MGYLWLEEAGLIAGTPEWEEKKAMCCMAEENAWRDDESTVHRGLTERRQHA